MEITADWNDRDQRERQQRSTVPFSLSLSAPFDWYLSTPAAAHSYFMSISHRLQPTLKNDCRGIEAPFSHKKNKILRCDLSTWLLKPGSGKWPWSKRSASLQHVGSSRIDPSRWDSDYRMSSSFFLFLRLTTKWIRRHLQSSHGQKALPLNKHRENQFHNVQDQPLYIANGNSRGEEDVLLDCLGVQRLETREWSLCKGRLNRIKPHFLLPRRNHYHPILSTGSSPGTFLRLLPSFWLQEPKSI